MLQNKLQGFDLLHFLDVVLIILSHNLDSLRYGYIHTACIEWSIHSIALFELSIFNAVKETLGRVCEVAINLILV